MKEGALRELPGGWVWTRLGGIAGKLQSGGTPSTKIKEFYENGTIPFVKIEDMASASKYLYNTATKITEEGLNNSSAWIVRENSLLYSMYASYGVPVINKVNVSTSQAIIAFLPPDGSIYVEYVYYYLCSIKPTLKTFIRGTTQENLNGAIVSNLPIPLPPLPEQRAIVSKIEQLFSDLDSGIENFKKAQAQLKLYRQSVLKAACEGKLVPTEAELARAEGRDYEAAYVLLARILRERRAAWAKNGNGAKYKEPLAPDANSLSPLPEGWCWANIEQIADHRLGKMLDKVKNKGELHPYLRNINVRWLEFDLSDIQYIRVVDDELENISVRNGDLVICEGGEPGRAAVWKKNEPMIIQKALHRVRTFGCVLPTYLTYCLLFDASTGRLEKYFTGTTIKHFTGQSLHSYVFPLPPLAEQRRIVAEVERRLSISDKMEVTIKESLQKAESLRQSILKKAFEGKLLNEKELEEARNAPDWEPAERLLERIKTEKGREVKNKHRLR